MKSILIFLVVFTFANELWANLKFDFKKNGAELIGPYISYNFLKEPHSLGKRVFDKSNIKISFGENKNSLVISWPIFLMNQGRWITSDHKRHPFAEGDLVIDRTRKNAIANFVLPIDLKKYKEELKDYFYFCIANETQASKIKICSDKYIIKNESLVKMNKSKKVSVFLNNEKVPRNATIMIPKEDKEFLLFVKYESGQEIEIQDMVKNIDLSQLNYDANNNLIIVKEKKDFNRAVEVMKLDYNDQVTEKIKDSFEKSFEFPISSSIAGIQLYGIVLPKLHIMATSFSLDADNPVATYCDEVTLMGKKEISTTIGADNNERIQVDSQLKDRFFWRFPAHLRGQFNDSSLYYLQDGKKYYFSNSIYRSFSKNFSILGSIIPNVTSITPALKTKGEYWIEKPFTNHKLFYQRIGLNFDYFYNFKEKIDGGQRQELLGQQTKFTLKYRMSPGVFPIESSWGVGMNHFQPQLVTSQSSDVSPSLLGLNFFWMGPPPFSVDNVLNLIPFVKYPKWVEAGAIYYPLNLSSDIDLNYSYSIYSQLKIFFSNNWFMDSSIEIDGYSLTMRSSQGSIELKTTIFQGSLGVGYMF